MKKTAILIILFAIMLLSVPFVHAAENMFSDITELIGDVFEMVSDISQLEVFQTEAGVQGLFFFLFWIALFSVLYMGTSKISNMSRNIRIVISAVPSTMMLIMMNFWPGLFVTIFGTWFVPIILIMTYAPLGFLAYYLYQAEASRLIHLLRAAIMILLSLLLLSFEILLVLKMLERMIGGTATLLSTNMVGIFSMVNSVMAAGFFVAGIVSIFRALFHGADGSGVRSVGSGIKSLGGSIANRAGSVGSAIGKKAGKRNKRIRENKKYASLDGRISTRLYTKEKDTVKKLQQIRAHLVQLKELDDEIVGGI